jgi:hypothetical protein
MLLLLSSAAVAQLLLLLLVVVVVVGVIAVAVAMRNVRGYVMDPSGTEIITISLYH